MILLRLPGTYPAQGDTRLLAGALARRGLAEGRRVLDLCTGTGALALAASAAGAREVVAVDLSRRVAWNARLNAALARAHVEVRTGDLFAPVAGERFGLVTVNPPYVPAASDELPRHSIARSWDAGVDGRALLDRICAGVSEVLEPGGVLLLTQSVLADEARTLEQLDAAHLDAEVVERVDEPFGPVMRRRAEMLRRRGLLAPGQRSEELVVIEARVRETAGAEAGGGRTLTMDRGTARSDRAPGDRPHGDRSDPTSERAQPERGRERADDAA